MTQEQKCIKELYELVGKIADRAKMHDLSLFRTHGASGCDAYQGLPPICRIVDSITEEYGDIIYGLYKEDDIESTIDIVLENGISGYDAVAEYIRRYWKHNIEDDVVVSLGVSYDGNQYCFSNQIAALYSFDTIEFLNDWWEGERFIKLKGIKSVSNLDVSTGGIYKE